MKDRERAKEKLGVLGVGPRDSCWRGVAPVDHTWTFRAHRIRNKSKQNEVHAESLDIANILHACARLVCKCPESPSESCMDHMEDIGRSFES